MPLYVASGVPLDGIPTKLQRSNLDPMNRSQLLRVHSSMIVSAWHKLVAITRHWPAMASARAGRLLQVDDEIHLHAQL